jgi:DnaJ-class molecular chaperone
VAADRALLGMKEAADTKTAETKCPACNGTGYPVVMQPVQPGRKIYPAPCKECGGKGRITEPAK